MLSLHNYAIKINSVSEMEKKKTQLPKMVMPHPFSFETFIFVFYVYRKGYPSILKIPSSPFSLM